MFLRVTDAVDGQRVCVNFDHVERCFRMEHDGKTVTALQWAGRPLTEIAVILEDAGAIAAALGALSPRGDQAQ